MVTLNEFLNSGHGYDEVIVTDKNGEELVLWTENDPKYDKNVLSTQVVDNDTALKVVIDHEKDEPEAERER